MRKFYTKLLVSFFIVFSINTRAQVSTYIFSQSSGTYTPITGGTLIAKATGTTGAAALDDVNYTQAAGTIPFTFTFKGTTYTGFNINTNGQITFGSTLPSTTNYFPISDATAYEGAVAALANDIRGIFATTANRTSGSNTLTSVTNTNNISVGDVVTGTGIPAGTTVTAIGAGTITMSAAATSTATAATFSFGTGEIRIATTGVAPNRVFVIQFSGFQRFGVSNSSLNFQIQLNEGGGNPLNQTVNVVYGPILQSSSTTFQVGLRGSTNTDFNNRTSTTSWTASTAGATNAATMTLSSTVFPASGTTFTWTPTATPPIDLTLVSVTATAANPCPTNNQAVSSVIKNTGANTIDFSTNNATVTVNITGSNPQTLTTTLVTGTLAPNATMTVPLAPNADLSNGGTNTLNGIVSITGDGLASNNTASTSITLVNQATLPVSVNFTGYSGTNLSTVFPGWSEGSGATTPTGTTSAWTSTTDLGTTGNVTSKINLFTNTRNEWIISPRFLANANTYLQYDVAVTDFASVTDPAVMGSDDKVSVMVSTDCGVTWTEVKAYTIADNLSKTLTSQLVNLGSFNGQNIMVAFKATDGPVNDPEDYDFHIDNIRIGDGCSGTPTAGSTNATLTTVCYAAGSTLSLTGSSSGIGMTYQWQFAPVASSTWTDIAGATSSTFIVTPVTAYQYRAKVTCSISGLFDFSSPVSINISGVPTYAALPYSQDFESWIDGCSTADRPGPNWANIPVTGNNSWRRDDQGSTAGWSNNNGLYSPSFSTGAHSARFNTWNAPDGTSGILDLFIDLSTSTDDKLLKFDYINPVGTDSLTIFLSNDGGATFVRLDSLKNRTSWSTKQIVISSTSPTAIIRFRAISDFGGGAADIGIDNLQMLVGCGGVPVSGSISVTGGLPVCINNSVTLNLTGQTSAAGIAYQWQSSTDNATFSNVPGATGTSLVVSPTSNTYYRVVVTCTNTSDAINTASQLVNVNSPSITSSTPATRCGIGTATLSASGSAGTVVKWYAVASGGTPLATGNSFITPSLSATTSYYVAAESGVAPVGSGNSNSTSYESPFYHLFGGKKSQYLILASELTASGLTAGNINTIGFTVVSAGATYNGFSISMKNTTAAAMTTTFETGLTTVYTSPAVTPVAGVNMYAFSTPFVWDGTSNVVVDVCWSNNNTGGSDATVKMNSTPFVSHAYYRADNQSVSTICGSATATSTSTLRPQFILDPAYCAGNRTPITATVTTPPAITLLPAAVSICTGQSATVIVNSTNSGYTYTWTGGQTGSPISVSPTATTKYIVTATDNSGGANNGCVNRDSITVTVNSLPPAVTITPSASAVCAGGIVTLNTNAGPASGTAIVTGTGPTSSTAAQSPFYRLFEGSRKQYLIRASELTALGLISGSTLTSVSINVAALNGTPNNLNNFRLKIGATSANTMSSFLTDPVTVVYNSASYSPVAGANVLNFTSTFTWNGTSNIFVEVCFDNDPNATCSAGSPTCWGNTPDVTIATAPFTSTVYYYADNTTGVRDMCGIATVTGTSATRPVMTFAYNNPTVSWSPVAGLFTDAAATVPYVAGTHAATLYAKPAATTTYTATSSTVFSCTSTSTVSITLNTPPAITVQPVNQIGCTGGNITFNVTATGTGLSYQWRKNGTNIGSNAPSLTLTNLSATDAATYDVVISGTCPSAVTSNAVTLVVGDNSWVGTSNSDWNNPLNWCGGIPAATTNVLIPSGTPFAPSINGNANANNLTINSGATVTIGAGGRLVLNGNLVNNGTFNSTAGTIEFRGSTNQNVPAITAAHIIMNGAGGITLGGTMNIGSSLTLTNGNITLGTNNLVMTGGTTGSTTSHIVTNGSGKVTNNNVGTATVVFPVAPNATGYNPVMIANGQGLNYSVNVATGVTPAIANSARAVNRTWNITSNTAPATPVSITLQYADADANGTPTANMEVGVHNGTSWITVSPAGGIAPSGSAAARQVSYQTTNLGPTVLANTGGINFPTAVSNVDPDVASVIMMPNIVNDNTMLRVFARRSMKIEWRIIDANGRTVMEFNKQVFAGQNDIQLRLGRLASGSYILTGDTEKGKTSAIRFIRL